MFRSYTNDRSNITKLRNLNKIGFSVSQHSPLKKIAIIKILCVKNAMQNRDQNLIQQY